MNGSSRAVQPFVTTGFSCVAGRSPVRLGNRSEQEKPKESKTQELMKAVQNPAASLIVPIQNNLN